ncbi:MAG: Druantia anti-phage system protein DruA [Candidatus Acidulodesulfobacterium sp.]
MPFDDNFNYFPLPVLTQNIEIENQPIDRLGLESSELENDIVASVCSDISALNFKFSYEKGKFQFENNASDLNDKDFIRNLILPRKEEIINKNAYFINKNREIFTKNIANGYDCFNSVISPIIEICETQQQRDLFRMLRYTWSSPYSEYVGRRIKFIIRDAAIDYKPVIGIAALGSSIIRIPERDDFIGWDRETKNKNLVYCMDLYVCGAVPPYSYLLGGKLIAYTMASKEVMEIFQNKYLNRTTIINKRKSSNLAAIFTTSLYGKSSQYNRIKYNGELLYKRIGQTKGFGTFQFSNRTNELLKNLLKTKEGKEVGYKFGDGSNYKFRFIKKALRFLENYGLDANFLLNHSIKRDIYYVPLAYNSLDFLNGRTDELEYFNYSVDDLIEYWKKRWLSGRKGNPEVIQNVLSFSPKNFSLL